MSPRRPPRLLPALRLLPTLSTREPDAREVMDDPLCDEAMLMRTYAQFRVINGIVAGWKRTYREHIRPRFVSSSHTLLDVGTGGGDIAHALVRWAARDGVALRVTAIDPDERAHRFTASETETGEATQAIDWRRAHSSELADAGESFDFVVSNHVLHHLDAVEFATVLADSVRLARRAAVHSDIRRSRMAFLLFGALTSPLLWAPPSRRSFIRQDGLTSIRRSFTLAELREVAPAGWSVAGQTPYRVVLYREGAADA